MWSRDALPPLRGFSGLGDMISNPCPGRCWYGPTANDGAEGEDTEEEVDDDGGGRGCSCCSACRGTFRRRSGTGHGCLLEERHDLGAELPDDSLEGRQVGHQRTKPLLPCLLHIGEHGCLEEVVRPAERDVANRALLVQE